MEKESLGDKIARKTMESAQAQKHWAMHERVFGPLLKEAFADSPAARLKLLTALNFISVQDIAKGLPKLRELEGLCRTDGEWAVYHFFRGLCAEGTGDRDTMAAEYERCNACGHGFYLPHLKMGKVYMDEKKYADAAEQYRRGIELLEQDGAGMQLAAAAAHGNRASCLLMLRRYEEAAAELTKTKEGGLTSPGTLAVEAALLAMNDDRDGAMAALKQLQRSSARSYGPVKKSVDKILLKKDPHFFVVPLKEKKIAEFWSWFGVYEDTLRQQLDERAYEAGIAPLLEQLRVTLPFWTEPDVTLGRNPVGYVLEMRDGYSASVEAGLRQLMAACPPEIRKLWTFVVEH